MRREPVKAGKSGKRKIRWRLRGTPLPRHIVAKNPIHANPVVRER